MSAYVCSPGGGWRSRIPISTRHSTLKPPRARRQLPFDPSKRQIYSQGSQPAFCPRPPRDPRGAFFTPKRDRSTYEERADLSKLGQHWEQPGPPSTQRKTASFMPSRGVNYSGTPRELLRSPDCSDTSGSWTTAIDSPASVYGTPHHSSHPHCPPAPPMPPPGTIPPPWDPEFNLRPCKMRSTALPGVVKPITSPFSYRDPTEFVTMHDLINQDYLRLGPFPPPRPLAQSTPKEDDKCYEYYGLEGLEGRFFPSARMFNAMPPGEWGPDEDDYWPDRRDWSYLYNPATAVAPNAPPKIKISPWPKHHPAPQC